MREEGGKRITHLPFAGNSQSSVEISLCFDQNALPTEHLLKEESIAVQRPVEAPHLEKEAPASAVEKVPVSEGLLLHLAAAVHYTLCCGNGERRAASTLSEITSALANTRKATQNKGTEKR